MNSVSTESSNIELDGDRAIPLCHELVSTIAASAICIAVVVAAGGADTSITSTIPGALSCEESERMCVCDLDADIRSSSAIMNALDEEPIEDGVTHRAEAMVEEHIETFGSFGISRVLRQIGSPTRGASLLRLLGRSEKMATGDRRAVVAWGLQSDSMAIRDAAIQAVENWEDTALLVLLRSHVEPIGWLASYQAGVVRDLGG